MCCNGSKRASQAWGVGSIPITGSRPPASTAAKAIGKIAALSSRGLGRDPLTVQTRVRIPVGSLKERQSKDCLSFFSRNHVVFGCSGPRLGTKPHTLRTTGGRFPFVL